MQLQPGTNRVGAVIVFSLKETLQPSNNSIKILVSALKDKGINMRKLSILLFLFYVTSALSGLELIVAVSENGEELTQW